jgi:glutamine synthetase
VVLNTIVADVLMEFADVLEKADDFKTALHDLIVSTLKKHYRIIFNGNGYSSEWVEEAARRGLPNYASTVDALPHLLDEKNIALFARQGVYSQAELRSRYEISLEYYAKAVNIEAETCLMMAERQIFPACAKFAGEMGRIMRDIREAGVEPIAEQRLLKFVTERNVLLFDAINGLREAILDTPRHTAEALAYARYERYMIIPAMAKVREIADDLESLVGRDMWPFPTYDDLLFNI